VADSQSANAYREVRYCGKWITDLSVATRPASAASRVDPKAFEFQVGASSPRASSTPTSRGFSSVVAMLKRKKVSIYQNPEVELVHSSDGVRWNEMN
jgi:hypothetical protein